MLTAGLVVYAIILVAVSMGAALMVRRYRVFRSDPHFHYPGGHTGSV